MKKTISKKLVVSSTTLRKLAAPELEGVAGGAGFTVGCSEVCTVTCGGPKLCTRAC
jgi:hypothetical protein